MKVCEVVGCNKKVFCRGYCPGHYRKLKIYGDPEAGTTNQYYGLSPLERFMQYVGPKPDESDWSQCWEWIGNKDAHGYGRMNIKNRVYAAHRLSWEFFIGPIPEGVNVLHFCDNTSCMRPRHLFLGTQSDNIKDMWKKGRARPGRSVGEKHGCSKWTSEDILAIRSSAERPSVLMERYGMSKTHFYRVKNHKIWRHI